MDSGRLFQQHFNIIDHLTVQEIDLEPNPVELETEEEEFNRVRQTIAKHLEHQYCKHKDLLSDMMKFKAELTQSMSSTLGSHDHHIEQAIMPGARITAEQFRYHLDLVEPGKSIIKHRQSFIHACIYCKVKNEAAGVDIYNIICDSCARKYNKLDKVFLSDEDYKHETLIFFDEE